jgi:hypothetical protein
MALLAQESSAILPNMFRAFLILAAALDILPARD